MLECKIFLVLNSSQKYETIIRKDRNPVHALGDTFAKYVGNDAVGGILHRSVATAVGSRQVRSVFDEVACHDEPVMTVQVTW